ncbi:MAG: hypothetical protein HDT13_10240 [Butyrivibrio sp.]|nr:hypothetical protein [Butyrivibrio sp.]
MSESKQRDIFTETLREVADIVRTSPDGLDREEVMGYFKDINLTDEQKDMVFEYLIKAQHDKAEPEDSENKSEPETPGQSSEKSDKETGNESKALKLYLEELEKIHEYSDAERERLCAELLDGSEDAIGKLSESMLKDVAVLAQEYASDKAGLEDLIQEGNLGIFVRLGELCGMGSDCGYDVVEELSEAADNAIRAYISDIKGEIDSENTVVGKLNLVNEAKKYLRGQNGHEPSAQELAGYTGMSVQELEDIESLCKSSVNGSVR